MSHLEADSRFFGPSTFSVDETAGGVACAATESSDSIVIVTAALRDESSVASVPATWRSANGRRSQGAGRSTYANYQIRHAQGTEGGRGALVDRRTLDSEGCVKRL